MAKWYLRWDGDDAKNGRTYENGKATWANLRGVAYVTGDEFIVAPGTYREQFSLPAGGSLRRETGSLSVTEGSKIVTGVGTAWAAAIQAGDRLFIPFLAYGLTATGTGGVGDGAGSFDSDGTANDAEFQANLVGFCINIATVGSYLIAGVTDSDTITLTDVNAVGWPGAGPFNFYVPSGEGSYEIESVQSDTQLTLKRPWSGPTYTWTHNRYKGVSSGTYDEGYEIIRPVSLIGDETGMYTDGIGGICRITGSDNDLTISAAADRERGISAGSKNYWVIKGFQIDSVNKDAIKIEDCTHITIEDVRTMGCGNLTTAAFSHIYVLGDCDRITIRRCAFFGGRQAWGVNFTNVTPGASQARCHVVENIRADCYLPFYVDDVNNITIKDCINGMSGVSFLFVPAGLPLGQSVFIHDCEIHYVDTTAIWPAANGQIIVNWCNFWENNADVWLITAGANCTAFLYLPRRQTLVDGFRYPARLDPPSRWWAGGRQYTGLYPANEDIYGVPRPTTKTKRSLGPYQDIHIERNAAITYGGYDASMEQPDARVSMFRIPITGDPTTVLVRVYLETNYAGTAPKLIVHQAGNTDVEATATGTTGTWELLSVAYTPNAQPLELWASVVSDNTAAALDYAVLWQAIGASGA